MNAPQTDMTQEQVRARVAERSAFRHRAARLAPGGATFRGLALGHAGPGGRAAVVVAPCRALDHAAESAT
jgi:hypothetical protein